MTRERAKELAPIIQAYVEGKEIESRPEGLDYPWAIANNPKWSDGSSYRIKSVPSTRPMTRGEVLYMLTTTTGMVTRMIGTDEMFIPGLMTRNQYTDYEYAIIDKHGDPIDGWHKFEVEESLPAGPERMEL